MSIFDAIERMKDDFVAQTGRDATDIYFGKNEIKEILYYKTKYSVTESSFIQPETVYGLNVHRTNDETHLGIGISSESI